MHSPCVRKLRVHTHTHTLSPMCAYDTCVYTLFMAMRAGYICGRTVAMIYDGRNRVSVQ